MLLLVPQKLLQYRLQLQVKKTVSAQMEAAGLLNTTCCAAWMNQKPLRADGGSQSLLSSSCPAAQASPHCARQHADCSALK